MSVCFRARSLAGTLMQCWHLTHCFLAKLYEALINNNPQRLKIVSSYIVQRWYWFRRFSLHIIQWRRWFRQSSFKDERELFCCISFKDENCFIKIRSKLNTVSLCFIQNRKRFIQYHSMTIGFRLASFHEWWNVWILRVYK